MEEHLTQVTRAKDALEMSYSELNAQYQKYKADNYTIEHEQAGQLFDLQSKHVALFSEHDKLQNEYHALQQTVARTVDENTKLTVELSKLNEERIRIVLERDELSAKYSTFSEERSLAEKTLQESIETKETQLSRMTTAYQELENTTNDQIKILKRRVESLEETLLHSNELTKKAQDEKRIVEVALAEKQKAHDMLLVAVGQFESKLEDSQYQLSRVSLQCTKQQTRLKELEENMDKRSETEKSVYEAKLKLQEELGIALEEVRLLEAKCAERDSQLASTVDKLNDVEREHKALTRGLQEKHEELNEARTSVLKVEKLLQDCREDWQLGVDKYESKIQHLTSSLVISQESSRTEKLLLEEQIAEKEAQVAKLETEVSFLQTTCLSLEQTNKRNQERFSSMIEGDLVHQELTRYQSELDGQRQAFDTLYAKYMSLQKQHAQCEEEKVTYSAALDNLFALLVEYYAQPDLTNKSKLECSLSEYVSGIERSVEHLYGHYTSLSSFLNALLPLLSSYDSDGIPVYDSSLPLDTSAPAVVDQLQFIISSIERLDDGSFDNYSMSQALFDNVLALLKSLFLSIQTAQYLRTDFASVREVLQVTQRTATSLASEKKLLEEKVLALENNITVQLKEMNSLTESLQVRHVSNSLVNKIYCLIIMIFV
ncbi:hypothetical protein EON65_09140 [archaeon]|nr:MAG: hypothetical protein EON65_09140 [archaeon]